MAYCGVIRKFDKFIHVCILHVHATLGIFVEKETKLYVIRKKERKNKNHEVINVYWSAQPVYTVMSDFMWGKKQKGCIIVVIFKNG